MDRPDMPLMIDTFVRIKKRRLHVLLSITFTDWFKQDSGPWQNAWLMPYLLRTCQG